MEKLLLIAGAAFLIHKISDDPDWFSRLLGGTAGPVVNNPRSVRYPTAGPPLVAGTPIVTISGKVLDAFGRPIRAAAVNLVTADGTIGRTATTSSFGIYTFDEVPAGVQFNLSTWSARYRFEPLTFFASVSRSDLDLVGVLVDTGTEP